ncbi:MAG: response regulator transcription factor [Stenomitos rutilans HA7619-LM2]|jgi:DNA-binding NarL/FixJ family response regulator|nr:response regulator transcription factor [Stenomitos rutilans HA7619-LM2]
MSQANIRVLIADDHPIVRNGMMLLIKYEPGMETVAEASNGLEAVQLFRQHQPDVTLMDLRMPELSGVQAISTIRDEFPHAVIIVLTTYDGDEEIYQGLQAGAKGYLLKDAPLDQVLEAIRIVHVGQNYIPPEVGAKLVERMSRPQLSDRERDVLGLMVKGKANQDIANSLYISEGTVKFHISSILRKLQVSDRTQAVLIALKRGITRL